MAVFLLKSDCNQLFLSQPGGAGALQSKPGTIPVLTPQTGELEQMVSFQGTNVPGGGHAYELTFVGGLVLDMPAFSKQQGQHYQLWSANGGANQLFTLLPVAQQPTIPSIFRLMNVNSGLMLDVPNSTHTPGTPVQQWSDNGTSAQQWQLSSLNGLHGTIAFEADPTPRQYETSSGAIHFTGSGFNPNGTYALWYMNVPTQPTGRAWRDTLAGFEHIATTQLTADANGNINARAELPILPGSEGVRAGGYASCVLEDNEGVIAAVALVTVGVWIP